MLPPPSETACEDEWAAAESVRDALVLEPDEAAPTSDTIPCRPSAEMARWAEDEPEYYPVARLPEPWARLAEMSRASVDVMA